MLSRDKQDLTLTQSCECHVKTHPWYWSLSPTSDQTEPLWTSFRIFLQNAIHKLCCWYWPYLKIVGEYNNSVEAANELATFYTLCQHFLQIFSCVNVASFSHIISSLILQTILQTIPITLLGAQTCNALLLLLTLLSIISWKFYFLDSFIIKVYYLVLLATTKQYLFCRIKSLSPYYLLKGLFVWIPFCILILGTVLMVDPLLLY